MQYWFTFLLVFFFYGSQLNAQRKKVEVIPAKNIQKIFIQADEVFEISIKTTPKDTIRYTVEAEGEYLQDIYINSSIEGQKLNLQSHYKKDLLGGEDKLAAHKVFAVNLSLEVPEKRKVVVLSNLASVYASGNFAYLETELKSGQAKLTNFSGRAFVVTYGGDVFITTKQANVEAVSNLGKVKVGSKLDFGKLIRIKSISGDILVNKTE